MSQTLQSPRPHFAEVFAKTVKPEVLHWISQSEARIGLEAYKKFLDDLPEAERFDDLLLAIGQSNDQVPDSFMYTLALRETLNWPVDGELADIFHRGIRYTRQTGLRQATIAWVMKTGTRFVPKPGEDVKFHDTVTGYNRTGKVKEVDRPIAAGLIETAQKKRVLVPAERLIKV